MVKEHFTQNLCIHLQLNIKAFQDVKYITVFFDEF